MQDVLKKPIRALGHEKKLGNLRGATYDIFGLQHLYTKDVLCRCPKYVLKLYLLCGEAVRWACSPPRRTSSN